MAPNVALGASGPIQRGWDLWILSIVMVTLAGLFVFARIWERVRRRELGMDDWTIIAALIFSSIFTLIEIEAVSSGFGHHADTLSQEQIVTALKFFAAQVVYKVIILLDKVAILLLYYRAFHVNRNFQIAAHITSAFIVTSNVAFIIATIFQCNPISGAWNKGFEEATCIDSKKAWISYATLNIFTDVVLVALPLRQVSKLNMSRFDKIGLALVFLTGLFFTATSIIRTTTLAASARDRDPTWGPLPAANWSVIEVNVGIIAACLPTLRSYLSFCLKPFLPSSIKDRLHQREPRAKRAVFCIESCENNEQATQGSASQLFPGPRRDEESVLDDEDARDYELSCVPSSEDEDVKREAPSGKEAIVPSPQQPQRQALPKTRVCPIPLRRREDDSRNHARSVDSPHRRMSSNACRGTSNLEMHPPSCQNRGICIKREVSTDVTEVRPPLPETSHENKPSYSDRFTPRDMLKEDSQREYYLNGIV